MATRYYYDGRQPQYYYYPPSSQLLAEPEPFQERSTNIYRRHDHYLNDNFRRDYRLQDNSDYSRHGLIPMEEVFRRGGSDVAPSWWSNRDYPHGGHDIGYHFPLQQAHQYQYPWQYEIREDSSRLHDHSMMVEMYVPLCCDECERKVRKHLKDIEGVESVSADQWEKKVVVVGHNLHPHFLLWRMQRDKRDSVFWSDRPR